MHLTLKKPPSRLVLNFLQQQAKFDDFIDIFNNQRPHQALDMKCPAEVYQPSTRPSRVARYRLSLAREDRGRHQLRPDLFRAQKD